MACTIDNSRPRLHLPCRLGRLSRFCSTRPFHHPCRQPALAVPAHRHHPLFQSPVFRACRPSFTRLTGLRRAVDAWRLQNAPPSDGSRRPPVPRPAVRPAGHGFI